MRNSPHASPFKQKGASPIVVISFLAMAAVILTVAFKIYPLMFESWQIEAVVDSFEEEKDLDSINVREVSRRFQARLQTNNVRDFKMKDNVFISMEDSTLTIEVDYEFRVNIYRNIDAILVLNKTLEKRF